MKTERTSSLGYLNLGPHKIQTPAWRSLIRSTPTELFSSGKSTALDELWSGPWTVDTEKASKHRHLSHVRERGRKGARRRAWREDKSEEKKEWSSSLKEGVGFSAADRMRLPATFAGLLLIIRLSRSEILTPPYFNLAEGKEIVASATCGVDTTGPELYCKLVGANADQDEDINLIQGQVSILTINIVKRTNNAWYAICC